MSKYIKTGAGVLAVLGLLVFPIIIRADSVTQLAASGVQGPEGLQKPLAQAKPASVTLSVWITAYTSDPAQTSDHPLITASGVMVRDGLVAANFLPFGTQIQIPRLFGKKVFTVADRMNQKFSERVDIWMPTVQGALNFGIRKADIVIVTPALAVR